MSLENIKKYTYDDWLDELLIYYLRSKYSSFIVFDNFIKYAKGNSTIERELGIKFYEEVYPQTTKERSN